MRTLFVAVLAGCLAGCSAESERPALPDAPPPDIRTIAPAPPDASAFAATDSASAAWTDGPVEVERTTDEATLRAVRTAAHDGFDRVVFEFAEAELPTYRIAWADAPTRQCASGHPVALAGEDRLDVHFSRTRAHTDAGLSTIAARSLAPDLPRLRALTLTCDFEGVVTWVLGLETPGPFRVTELSDPTRLVIDVRH